MIVGSFTDFRAWLASTGATWSGSAPVVAEPVQRMSITLPETYQRHIAVIDAVFEPLAEPPFRGAALYVAESWVRGEEATPIMFNRLRSCALERKCEINEEPFTAFEPEEYDDLYALTLLAALGRWDAWVVARTRPYVIWISNDGFFDIDTSEVPVYERLAARVAAARFPFKDVV